MMANRRENRIEKEEKQTCEILFTTLHNKHGIISYQLTAKKKEEEKKNWEK